MIFHFSLSPDGAPLVVKLMADTSALERQCAEFRSLLLEAGDIPESVMEGLHDLLDEFSGELAFCSPVSAVGAGELIVEVRFREGGKFDRCSAALLALRDGRETGRGGLRGQG